jgi:DNA invertase Pin-like site-specific DNA recombinase
MKYIAYIRVSTEQQDVYRQTKEINEKFLIHKTFEEKVSAKDMERAQLKAMLEFIREGDTIVIESYSRISRSLTDLWTILEILNKKNVELISLRENFNSSTPVGKLMISFLGALGQYEREIILDRQRIGIERAKKQGKYKGRKRIPLPENFDSYLIKYLNKNSYDKYTLKMFKKETNLKQSTLISFINQRKSIYINKDKDIEININKL